MSLKLVLHAPTAHALARARRNLSNLLDAEPAAEVLIVANADGVPAALAAPDARTDGHLRLCRKTLERAGLDAPADIATVAAAVVELVRLQGEGWAYVRA